MNHSSIPIPNATIADYRTGGRQAAELFLRQMNGADGRDKRVASHDPFAVQQALLTAAAHMRDNGAAEDKIVAWMESFGDVIDGYGVIACAEVAGVTRRRPATRADLLESTAVLPAMDLAGDRAQLALVGIDTPGAIAASARTATLEDCRRLGEEHGEQDARDDCASSARMSVEAIHAHQIQRYLRRTENLRAAGLSEAQLAAYQAGAAASFKSRLARVANTIVGAVRPER